MSTLSLATATNAADIPITEIEITYVRTLDQFISRGIQDYSGQAVKMSPLSVALSLIF